MADPIPTQSFPGTAHLTEEQRIALTLVVDALANLSEQQAEEVVDHAMGFLCGNQTLVPAFARGVAGPLGKLDCELKTKVDEVTFQRFRQSCALLQVDSSARLRDAIYVLEWKKSYRQMVVEKVRHEEEHSQGLLALIGHVEAPEFLGQRTRMAQEVESDRAAT